MWMGAISDDEMQRAIQMQLREPKKISELKIEGAPDPASPYEPHFAEAIKRYLEAEMAQGNVMLHSELIRNATGSREKTIISGRWKLTELGLKRLTAKN